MKIGDQVLYKGKVATVINEIRPKCRCKGHGYFELHIEEGNYRDRIPLTTILEPYKPLTMAAQKIEPLKF